MRDVRYLSVVRAVGSPALPRAGSLSSSHRWRNRAFVAFFSANAAVWAITATVAFRLFA